MQLLKPALLATLFAAVSATYDNEMNKNDIDNQNINNREEYRGLRGGLPQQEPELTIYQPLVTSSSVAEAYISTNARIKETLFMGDNEIPGEVLQEPGTQEQPLQKEDSRNSSDVKRDHGQSSTQYGWTDEEFEQHLHGELKKDPIYNEYKAVFDLAPKCISKWRQRYRGNPSIWKRIFQKDRVLKEFIEAAPIIEAVQKLVENSDLEGNQKYTIIDLACGRGYLSMILSEMLPPEKVKKFVLVDKQWPMHGNEPKPSHISWTHIYGSFKKCEDQTIPNYYETWPIPLNTSKQDLKSASGLRKMEQVYFQDGPIILVAVHLCGILSIKAVELFNNNPSVRFFVLKPCCLPGMVHAKRDEIFKLGPTHCFDAKLVCMAGRWKKNVWRGPPRTQLKSYFERWAENLYLGIDGGDARKIQKHVEVQSKGGYQNEFLFAERLPGSEFLWGGLFCRPVDANAQAKTPAQ
ncbi:unnamed protein product [Cylindrotheca closterium]|uniref:Methyltransferase domain-containing protein n=1 Tax=Cylindrotheca closterium TaxID=2856 RepID=A0AAD2G4H0_9STRA|nr:unnamed protein product [Cylindrotheca closterium]